MDLLLPGDVILADRGFLIEDGVELRNATVDMPAFTKGRTQLHPIDLEETRKLGNVRINVERCIGDIRQKYSILAETMPISIISKSFSDYEIMPIDQIPIVCCALFNLCPSIVNF